MAHRPQEARRRPRHRRMTGVVVTSVLALSACGAGGTDAVNKDVDPAVVDIYSAARDEETITLYSSQNPELIDSTLEAFKEEYPGVDVQSLRLASGALATRYAEEQDAGVCTAGAVVIGDPGFLDAGTEQGWFQQLDAKQVPTLASWPADYFTFGTSTRISLIPAAITTNTDEISEEDAPKTVEDLLDPELKGKIVLVDPRSTPGWMALMQLIRDEYGDDFLRDLAAQDVTFADSSVPATQQVAAGERAVVFPTITSVADPLASEGAPLVTNILETGPTTGIEQFAALSECTKSPNAAHLLMDFLLSPDGQTAVNGEVAASPRTDVSGTLPLPDGYQDPAIDQITDEDEEAILGLLGL